MHKDRLSLEPDGARRTVSTGKENIAHSGFALSVLSVLGLYLTDFQYKILRSIIYCLLKIALYLTTTFPCSRHSMFYLIFKLWLGMNELDS